MDDHRVVSKSEWIEARKNFLAKEKEFTRMRDRLSEERRELPWERVEKDYVFDGPNGKETFSQLFDGRSQLIVYHFMFDPAWDAGCKHCSWWADNFERNVIHLKGRDTTLVAISRAPLSKIEAFRKRIGWTFKWLSSADNDFNYDLHVSATPEELAKGEMEYNFRRLKTTAAEHPGISVFYKDAAGKIFHTYSTYERGLDMMNAGYHFLDLTPKGRDEAGLSFPQEWVRYRDSYEG